MLYPVSVRCEAVMWREKKLFCNADFFHASPITSHGHSNAAVYAHFRLCHVSQAGPLMGKNSAPITIIIRPSADYISPDARHWVPMDKRYEPR